MKASPAGAPSAKDPANAKIQVVNAVEDVFLAKACFTIVGFALKEAIIGTLTGTGVEEETGAVEDEAQLGLIPHAIVTHMLLVGFVVGLRQLLDRRATSLTASPKRQATLIAFMSGLDLIPAWSFKGAVANVTAGDHGIFCALAVLLFATVVALVSMPEPLPAGEPEGVVHSLRRVLATSMGLGVGFAMNAVPQHLWKEFAAVTWGPWFQIPVMLVYPAAATALVVPIQVALGHFLAGGGHSHFMSTFVNFVKVANNFVVAWAWDGLLNTLRLAMLNLHPRGCLEKSGINLLWAVLIVLLALCVIFLLAHTRDPNVDEESEMRKATDALALLASGVIVAWGFLDFIVGLYKCIDLRGWDIVGGWLFAAVVVVLAALSMTGGTHLAEKLKAT